MCNKCKNQRLCVAFVQFIITLLVGPSKWVLVTVLVLLCCWIMSCLTTGTCYCGLTVSCVPYLSPRGHIINYFLSLLISHWNLFAPFVPNSKLSCPSFLFLATSLSQYPPVPLMAGNSLRELWLRMQRQQPLPCTHARTGEPMLVAPCMYRVIFVHRATHMGKMGQAFREK